MPVWLRLWFKTDFIKQTQKIMQCCCKAACLTNLAKLDKEILAYLSVTHVPPDLFTSKMGLSEEWTVIMYINVYFSLNSLWMWPLDHTKLQ